jgi:hypothetical protein
MVQFVPRKSDGTITARYNRYNDLRKCVICFLDIQPSRLCLVGGSFSPQRGYVSGFFHNKCWKTLNVDILSGRMITMPDKTQVPLPVAEIGAIDAILEAQFDWDYKQSELVDKEIVMMSFERTKTQYGEALFLRAIVDDKEAKVLISSSVLFSQLVMVEDKLPLKGVIKKVKNYYTF